MLPLVRLIVERVSNTDQPVSQPQLAITEDSFKSLGFVISTVQAERHQLIKKEIKHSTLVLIIIIENLKSMQAYANDGGVR